MKVKLKTLEQIKQDGSVVTEFNSALTGDFYTVDVRDLELPSATKTYAIYQEVFNLLGTVVEGKYDLSHDSLLVDGISTPIPAYFICDEPDKNGDDKPIKKTLIDVFFSDNSHISRVIDMPVEDARSEIYTMMCNTHECDFIIIDNLYILKTSVKFIGINDASKENSNRFSIYEDGKVNDI